ncbi:hypothetical protein BDQ17DRAFT_1251603 [Cyathus striatus]|nr:hypothetical protein BDQ17DRAFT_1251603 [Cyathus striatus]
MDEDNPEPYEHNLDPAFPLDSVPTLKNDNLPELVQDDDHSKPFIPPPEPKFCKPEECAQGIWRLRDPPMRTLSDLQKVYPPTHRGTFTMCGSEENHREEADRQQFYRLQEQRLVDVMNYVWKPERGEMVEWDADKFLVRLLQSPGGLIFCGDSISRQQFQYLEYALASAGVYILEDPEHLSHYDHHRLHQYILKPGDEKTNYLRELAGVPEGRLLRPIYTKMDNHILIGEKDIREIVGELGAQEDFTLYDIFDYFPDWEKFLEDMAEPRPGEEDSVTHDTVVIMNAGAHWSRGTFYMLPQEGTAQELQARVSKAYARMINRVTSSLAPMSQLSIFYRASAAAHPACAPKTKPYDNTTHAIEMEGDMIEAIGLSTTDEFRNIVQRWDWDRFDTHNRLWESKVDELAKRREYDGKGAKWFFMDVWNMTLQRPDAHTQNLDTKMGTFDCLHWCVPGVVEQWTRLLNHWLFWTPGMEYA